GDYVVAVVKNSGTNKGAMPSMGLKKPTNKPMSFTGADVVKMANGKGVESWSFYNAAAIAMQLGLMPAPGADKGAAPADGATPADGAGKDSAMDKGKKPAKGDMKKDEAAPAEKGGATL